MGEVWVPEAASSVAGVPVPNRATELQLGIQVLLHVHAHLAQLKSAVLCSAGASNCSLLDLGVSNIRKSSPAVEEASIKEKLSKEGSTMVNRSRISCHRTGRSVHHIHDDE
jgi:hypothetical protein